MPNDNDKKNDKTLETAKHDKLPSASAVGAVPVAPMQSKVREADEEDIRECADSRFCHCGASLKEHNMRPPFEGIARGSTCKAFNLDPNYIPGS